jgi:hypothetical protein
LAHKIQAEASYFKEEVSFPLVKTTICILLLLLLCNQIFANFLHISEVFALHFVPFVYRNLPFQLQYTGIEFFNSPKPPIIPSAPSEGIPQKPVAANKPRAREQYTQIEVDES